MKAVLIFENDIDTLEVVSDIFEYGVYTSIAYKTKIPLSKVIDINPNLILIDYLLDNTLGSDLCLELKSSELTKHYPVIMFSANYKVEQIATNSRADAFLAKPFDLHKLLQLVNELALKAD